MKYHNLSDISYVGYGIKFVVGSTAVHLATATILLITSTICYEILQSCLVLTHIFLKIP